MPKIYSEEKITSLRNSAEKTGSPHVEKPNEDPIYLSISHLV